MPGSTTPARDGRRVRGDRSRTAILDAAVALASVDGIEGLSLGKLADSIGVSKSGLFAHWRGKEELQLAAVDHAARQWVGLVVEPARARPAGIRRLFAVHEARLAFYAAHTLPGGCFFAAARQDTANHPGPLRDLVARHMAEWHALLARYAVTAVRLGELPEAIETRQLAYEIDAMGLAVVTGARLLDERSEHRFARRAVLDRLRALSPTPDLLPEE